MLMQLSGWRRPMLIAVRGIQPGKRDPVQSPCSRCSGVGVRLQVSGPYEILQAKVEIVRGCVHAEAFGRGLLGCGYTLVGESIEPVRRKARAGVGSDVSGLQQFID